LDEGAAQFRDMSNMFYANNPACAGNNRVIVRGVHIAVNYGYYFGVKGKILYYL